MSGAKTSWSTRVLSKRPGEVRFAQATFLISNLLKTRGTKEQGYASITAPNVTRPANPIGTWSAEASFVPGVLVLGELVIPVLVVVSVPTAAV